MIVYCAHCDRVFDDVDHWTFCPHDPFEINCTASFHGHTKVCHSTEELKVFLAFVEADITEMR